VVASITKRAQMPFSAWLPAAMAAPTPVSALVHSSTLVTAGVYLLIRHSFLLGRFNLLKYLLLVGAMTMFMAGISAIKELDIKKVVALSTLRQLGLIIIIIGRGLPLLGFFHLLSHAYFKAILFMCAGILIHRIKDYQDIRTMGLGASFLPLTIRVFTTANLRLCGMPFMAGFYSKDLILEIVIISSFNLFIFFIAMVSTFLTVFYTCRLSFLTGVSFVKRERIYSLLDYDLKIVAGMGVLFLPTLRGGIFLRWSIFSFSPSIILPRALKLLVPVLIIRAVFINRATHLRRKEQDESRVRVWAISNMVFLPLTFRVEARKTGLQGAKDFIKNNDRTWNELVLYGGFVKLIHASRALQEKTFISLFSKRALIRGLIFLLLF
jgi:NADH-ubiquinone oxidoreductase chain 5